MVCSNVARVNRTDRLHALVEELRAVSPRPRSARELGERFEVSARTIERDIVALQQANVPIHAEFGRRGGYVLDKSLSLPPLDFTPEEAVAVAVALGRSGDQLSTGHATSALRKLLAAMPPAQSLRARELAERVRLLTCGGPPQSPVAAIIESALVSRTVLDLEYADALGRRSRRLVEPHAFIGARDDVWYLIGWCRLRDAARVFRVDRIAAVTPTSEHARERPASDFTGDRPAKIPALASS